MVLFGPSRSRSRGPLAERGTLRSLAPEQSSAPPFPVSAGTSSSPVALAPTVRGCRNGDEQGRRVSRQGARMRGAGRTDPRSVYQATADRNRGEVAAHGRPFGEEPAVKSASVPERIPPCWLEDKAAAGPPSSSLVPRPWDFLRRAGVAKWTGCASADGTRSLLGWLDLPEGSARPPLGGERACAIGNFGTPTELNVDTGQGGSCAEILLRSCG